MSTLLPCPFCGGDATIEWGGEVTCLACGAAAPEDRDYGPSVSVKNWNTRHQPAWLNEPTEEGYHWLFDYADKARGDRLVWIEKAYDHGWCIPEEGRYTHSMICQRVQKATTKPEVK